MSERPSDGMQRPAKRRTEGQITKDDFENDDDDTPSVDPGTWRVADDETLKKRKIIKVRRHTPASMEAAAPAAAPASANPFASVSLTAPVAAPSNPFANIMLVASQPVPSASPAPAPAAPDGAPTIAETSAPKSEPSAAVEAAAAAVPSTDKPIPEKDPVAAARTEPAAAAGGTAAAVATETPALETAVAGPAAAAAAASSPPSTTAPVVATATPATALPLTPPALTPPASSVHGASSVAVPGSGVPTTPSLFSSFATSNASPFTGLTSGGKPFSGFGGFGSNGFASFGAGATPETGTKQGTLGFSFGSPNGGLAVAAVQTTPSSVFGQSPAGGAEAGGDGDGPATVGTTPPVANLQPAEPTVTGEEDETTVFSCDGVLFEFDSNNAWKERGRGELRVNLHQSGQARMVMRQKGNLRLLLNANLFPQIHVTSMIGGKGVTFSCVNAAVSEERTKSADSSNDKAGEDKAEEEPTAAGETGAVAEEKAASEAGAAVEEKAAGDEAQKMPGSTTNTKLGTYGIRIKQADKLREFIHTVETYKGKPQAAAQ